MSRHPRAAGGLAAGRPGPQQGGGAAPEGGGAVPKVGRGYVPTAPGSAGVCGAGAVNAQLGVAGADELQGIGPGQLGTGCRCNRGT